MTIDQKHKPKYEHILIATLWACWPALLGYLLILQLGYISRSRVGLAILFVPLLSYLIYENIPSMTSFSYKRWLYIGFASAVVAMIGQEVLLFYPQRTYLFDTKHKLEIRIASLPAGGTFAINGFHTSLGDVSFNSFQESTDWKRAGNELVPVSNNPNPLTWLGWVGNDTKLYLQGSSGDVIQVGWDGNTQTREFSQADLGTISIDTTFAMPVWGSYLLFIVLWASVAYTLTLGFVIIQKNPNVLSGYLPPAWLIKLFLSIALLLGVGLILKIFLPLNPNASFPSRDSGVFLYIAHHILEGQIPYRDIWDHKGPLIYYIDALGLILGKGSEWGVWCLEIFWILCSIGVLFYLLAKVTGPLPALVGCVIFLSGIGQALAGGNFTEEYGLLFQILVIVLFLLYLQSGHWLPPILAGVFTSLLFLLRPNQIAVGIGFGLYQMVMIVRSRFSWPTIRSFLFLSIGFSLSILITGAYFAINNALGDLASAVFTFNRIYVGPINIDLVNGFYQGLYSFPSMGFWVVIGSAAIFLLCLTDRRNRVVTGFWAFITASFLTEIFLSNLSQAGFRHYYLTWLPYIALFAALAVQMILRGIIALFNRWQEVVQTLLYGVAILISILGMFHISESLRSTYYPPTWTSAKPAWDTPEHPVNELRAYLGSDSSLLVWGAETSINYMTGVDAPTRFVYQYPLMSADYATPGLVNEFTSDISTSLPVIVDASAGDIGIIPLEKQQREQILMTPDGASQYDHLLPFFNYFDLHYRLVGRLSYHGWLVYLPIR